MYASHRVSPAGKQKNQKRFRERKNGQWKGQHAQKVNDVTTICAQKGEQSVWCMDGDELYIPWSATGSGAGSMISGTTVISGEQQAFVESMILAKTWCP